MSSGTLFPFFFFFNDTATTEIYTLSLHDALPICAVHGVHDVVQRIAVVAAPLGIAQEVGVLGRGQLLGQRELGRLVNSLVAVVEKDGAMGLARMEGQRRDRKSTRLNSSHLVISYAVFCLKKKQT